MHGIIFASLHDYARAKLGREAARELFGMRVYSMSEAHPDEELIELLTATAERQQVGIEELLGDFGSFTAEHTFARLYPSFFDLAGGTLPFLLTVEDRIHELVRATIPNAKPPALTVRAAGASGVDIDYSSPRQLCVLLIGLVQGTARHYGEEIDVLETACMRRDGVPACRFRVTARSE